MLTMQQHYDSIPFAKYRPFAKKKASAKGDVLYIYITRWDKPQHSRQISNKNRVILRKKLLVFH